VVRRILLAYDDTPGARQALAEAVQLARHEGARLIVVAIQGHLARFDGYTVGEIRNEHERRQRDGRRWLRTVEAYADDNGVRVRTDILTGSVTRQLARAARACRADLVVMAREDQPEILKRIIGTQAERVSRRAQCPVLIATSPRPPRS
jgi:nucleotide-binding universal stress UspA family protein